ncbi:MAG TPA: 2OG-Fe(II) oxygenase [Polyangiaceae bacterium]|nr:2OG-Fe(II) oxygenase [Polyangiaceae bacterium]
MSIFADARYAQLAASSRDAYGRADPFPHAVFDDFLPDEVARRALAEFPGVGADWHRYDNARERKLASREDRHFGPATRALLHELNALDFLKFLEALTGIGGLISDPHYEGGGLHQIERGGRLGVHADFNYHPIYRLDRRINVLIYLNEGWRDEWHGHLELWDGSMSRCAKKVAPLFNRCVVFNTTDDAFHGHPEPLACPPEVTRKSLALYYYSNGRPAREAAGQHSTLFRRRPHEVNGPVAWAVSQARHRVALTFRKLARLAEP